MELKFPTVMLLILLFITLIVPQMESREITHEDIKEAMLSLVHMMRDNTEKLERHEARDRQTAEQLKKALTLLTKRMSTVDNIKAHLVKLDEKVNGIEQLITQEDERERFQIQKTTDALEELERRLEGWASEIETKIVDNASSHTSVATSAASNNEILDKLGEIETKINDRLVYIEQGFESKFDNVVGKPTSSNEASLLAEVRYVRDKINYVAQGLDKLEDPGNNPGSPVSEEQMRAFNRLQDLLQAGLEQIRELPRITEMQIMHNETQMTLQETKHALKDAIDEGNEATAAKIDETIEEARDSITSLRSELSNNSERISQELNDLGKGQSVMVEMADHVLDTKKRLEHAYKIIREVGELVAVQGLTMNHTLNSRFDGISNDIMDNQKGALANLTVKMEQEMSQIWRQINVMYQQMMESAKALDKLHKQNEAYVNGTTETMDHMESKVGEITKRMSEVDENLNFLLGRLSLVTHEFNQIKQGLGAALDNIKASFKEVQEKANDLTSSNPGPHPVPQNYKEPTAESAEETPAASRR